MVGLFCGFFCEFLFFVFLIRLQNRDGSIYTCLSFCRARVALVVQISCLWPGEKLVNLFVVTPPNSFNLLANPNSSRIR